MTYVMSQKANKFMHQLIHSTATYGYFLESASPINLVEIDIAKIPNQTYSTMGDYTYNGPDQDAEVTNIKFNFNFTEQGESKFYSPVLFIIIHNDISYKGKSYLDAAMKFAISLDDVVDSIRYLLEPNSYDQVSVVISSKIYKFSLVT